MNHASFQMKVKRVRKRKTADIDRKEKSKGYKRRDIGKKWNLENEYIEKEKFGKG